MAVAHLLHGRGRKHRVVGLRPQRRQVAQKLREVDPLLAEVVHREVVLLADVAEVLLEGRAFRRHQGLEPRGLAVRGVEAHDASLDDRTVELEVALVGVVVGRDLLRREDRIDRLVDIMLVELADQQGLAVLLDHAVDVARRRGEERLGLAQLQLLADPAVDVDLHVGGAVLARKTRRNDRTYIVQPQLLAAGPGDGRVAGKIPRELPATRQQQHPGRDRYFRSPILHTEGKDTIFTWN